MNQPAAEETLKAELKPLAVHVIVLLIAEAIVYLLAKATGWLFSFSLHTQITIAAVMTLIVLVGFTIRVTLKSRQQQSLIRALQSRVENAEKTNLINPQLNEYVHELEADGKRHPYPYSYSLVSQEAIVDASGGYAATYVHDANNDSDRVINTYEFHLRTSDRVHFADLRLQAWVSIDNRPLVQAACEGEPWASRAHRVVVHFQTPVAKNSQFKVQLQFSFPNALKSGQDGDAIDLGRFKSVSRATMKLVFAKPVEQPGWYWLPKMNAKENTLQLYPWPPTIGVYSFICLFKADVSQAAVSNAMSPGIPIENNGKAPVDLGSAIQAG